MKQITYYRNQDLLEAARRAVSKAYRRGETINIRQLVDAALSHSPKMHYVDFDTASDKLHAIRRHGLDAIVNTAEGRAKWAELGQQVDEIMAARRRLTFAQALSFVLHFRRPSRFYITRNAAYKIIAGSVRKGFLTIRG